MKLNMNYVKNTKTGEMKDVALKVPFGDMVWIGIATVIITTFTAFIYYQKGAHDFDIAECKAMQETGVMIDSVIREDFNKLGTS